MEQVADIRGIRELTYTPGGYKIKEQQPILRRPFMQSKSKLCTNCASALRQTTAHPDHKDQIRRVNRIIGQLEGVKRMIEEKKYCPDIVTQAAAVRAAVVSLEKAILKKHLSSCVRDAFLSGNNRVADDKIRELLDIFSRTSR